jgi:hypothetical protein
VHDEIYEIPADRCRTRLVVITLRMRRFGRLLILNGGLRQLLRPLPRMGTQNCLCRPQAAPSPSSATAGVPAAAGTQATAGTAAAGVPAATGAQTAGHWPTPGRQAAGSTATAPNTAPITKKSLTGREPPANDRRESCRGEKQPTNNIKAPRRFSGRFAIDCFCDGSRRGNLWRITRMLRSGF